MVEQALRRVLPRFGWSRRNPVPGEVTSADEHWLIGMGMATAICPASRFPSQVKVRLQADGTRAGHV
jgi:xanthine dehydrogenase YagR molybdenum-binding subunit